jgi:hypothetical protein
MVGSLKLVTGYRNTMQQTMAISGASAPKAVLRLLGRKETQGGNSSTLGLILAALLLASSLLASSLLLTTALLVVALLVVLISHLGLQGSIGDRPGAWSPEGPKAERA